MWGSIASRNGLLPIQCQAVALTDADELNL